MQILITFYRASDTDAQYWYSKYVRPSVCLFVRPSVRPLRSNIVWKRLSMLSHFFFSVR